MIRMSSSTRKTYGIRYLKAHLSRCIEEVKSSEVILITDRGRVVAELREPAVDYGEETPFARALAKLVRAGQVRVGHPTPVNDLYQPTGLRTPSKDVQRLLDESRGEG